MKNNIPRSFKRKHKDKLISSLAKKEKYKQRKAQEGDKEMWLFNKNPVAWFVHLFAKGFHAN